MAIALVKSAKGSAATSTVSPAFGSATASGNLIVLAFAADDYNGTPGAGWTQSAEMEQQGFHGAYIWWRISTGETSYSYTIGSATNSSWVIAEYSGADATPYDISEGQFVNSSGANYTTPTITPSTGNRVLVAMIGGSATASMSGTSIGTWLNSFTAVDSQGSGGSGTNDLVGMAYSLVTGDGSTTFSTGGTYNGGVGIQSRSGLIISFKEAVSAGSPYTLVAGTGTLTAAGQTAELYNRWRLVGVGTSVQSVATGHTLTLPAGVQQDDLLIAVISSRIASTTSITLPTGGEWTLCAEQKTNNVLTTTSAVPSGMMAYCIRGASDPNLVFTHPTAPSVALGRIVAYRGGYVGGWLDQSNSITTAVNTTSVSVAGVTTAFPGDLIVVGLCGGQEAAWSAVDATNPSVASGATDTATHPRYNTWIERADVTTTTGSDTSLGIADAVRTAAGATGNITATAGSAASHVVLIGAFRPAVLSAAPYTLVAGTGTLTLAGQTVVPKVALPAGLGTLTLSGQVAGLKFGHKVTAGTSTLTLGGQAVTLAYARKMPAATGTLTLSGQAATLARARMMPAGTGTLTLSGQAATLKRTTVMPAGLGTLILAGQAVTLTKSAAINHYTMPTSPATMTLAGQAVALRAVRKLTAGQATLTLSGQATALRAVRTVVAGLGTLTLAGQATALRSARKMVAGLGTLTLSGQATFLRYTRLNLTAGTGTLTLAGQIVVTRFAHRTTAGTGTLTLVGQAAALNRKYVMPVTTGTLTLSGQMANLDWSGAGAYLLSAGLGGLVASGQAVTLRYAHKLLAANGTLTLSGQPVTARFAHAMLAGQGTLTLAGQVVSVRYGHKLAAGLGTLTLAGQPVTARFAHKITAGLGTLTLSGRAAVLTRSRVMVATHGQLTLSGPTVNLIWSSAGEYTIPAGVGVLVASGQVVTLRRARVMPAAFGTVTLSGQPILLKYSRAVPAGVGTLTLAGQPASLVYDARETYALSAAPGILTLAGQDIRLDAAIQTITAQPGRLTFGRKVSIRRW